MVKFTKYWTREYSFWYEASALESCYKWIKTELGIDITAKGEGENGWWATYTQEGTIEKVKSFYEKIVCEDLEAVDLRIDQLIRSGKNYVAFSKSSDKYQSKEELVEGFSKYYDSFLELCMSLWACYYMVESVENAVSKEVVLKYGEEKSLEVISAISTPLYKAAIMRLSEFLLSDSSFEKKVEFMLENFAYIGSADPFSKPFGRLEVEDYVRCFKAVHEEGVKNNIDTSLLNPKLVLVYQKLLWVKDYRDELRREGFFKGYAFLKRVADEFDLEVIDLSRILPSELEELMKFGSIGGKKLSKVFSDREKACVAIYDGEFTVFSGQKAYDMIHENKKREDSVSEFSGKVGCKGKVTGEVYILKSEKDVPLFPLGKVLVATITNPGYLPAMNKAIAYVTNEGGITSHAAIVAREMGVPCIVGTKMATNVLKNGDLVEVDAVNGVVRKVDCIGGKE
jgi:phosphohistidine swiveling domain-containing protein